MKQFFSSLALLFVITSSLWANLGETDVQIMNRYGKMLGAPTSLSNRDVTKYFLYKDHFIVTVTLIDGVSQREAYSRKDTKDFTAPEIETLLGENALGSKWAVMNDKTNKVWILDSKAALASYDKHEYILTMETQAMVGFDNALKALSEKQHH